MGTGGWERRRPQLTHQSVAHLRWRCFTKDVLSAQQRGPGKSGRSHSDEVPRVSACLPMGVLSTGSLSELSCQGLGPQCHRTTSRVSDVSSVLCRWLEAMLHYESKQVLRVPRASKAYCRRSVEAGLLPRVLTLPECHRLSELSCRMYGAEL